MTTIGICEHCSKGGAVETVEVSRIGTSEPLIALRLCRRCATQPNAVWRRRYQPARPTARRPA